MSRAAYLAISAWAVATLLAMALVWLAAGVMG